MSSVFDDEERDFVVVRNHEEQYSIWPADRDRPAGWEPAGFAGRRAPCLEWIAREWTDLRPKSLRERAAR